MAFELASRSSLFGAVIRDRRGAYFELFTERRNELVGAGGSVRPSGSSTVAALA
jgi:hypothetical protein